MRQEHLRYYLNDLKMIQESSFSLGERKVGYHATCLSTTGRPLGSGTHSNRETAHVIAVAEAIERRVFSDLYHSTGRAAFLLDEYPTTCGFAVGNNKLDARNRSTCEAIERWLRSKWIDERYYLTEIPVRPEALNDYQRTALGHFDDLRAFSHVTKLESSIEASPNYYSLIVVGFKDHGAFVGSKTSVDPHQLWSQALTEAWRHLHISQHIARYPDTFDHRIICHFSRNKENAVRQIHSALQPGIPKPRIRLQKEVSTPFQDLFCYRTLCHDFRGWHEENLDRFVY